MEISNGMIAMVIGVILTYIFLLKNNQRLWRMCGALLIIVLGISFVVIEDTIPMFLLASVCIVIGGITFIKEVAEVF